MSHERLTRVVHVVKTGDAVPFEAVLRRIRPSGYEKCWVQKITVGEQVALSCGNAVGPSLAELSKLRFRVPLTPGMPIKFDVRMVASVRYDVTRIRMVKKIDRGDGTFIEEDPELAESMRSAEISISLVRFALELERVRQ